jgi:restriction endonuclease S subunit
MAVWTSIQLSDIRSGFRIDAEFYKEEYIQKDHELLKLKRSSLGHLAKVTDGEHGSVKFVSSGIKYLTAENVKQGYVDFDGVRFVGQEVDQRNARARVNVGDVLISIKGTLGEVGVAEMQLLPANMNRDVAIIKPFSSAPSGHYISAFLRSSYGAYQLAREGSGGVQQMITLERLRGIQIPLISDNGVNLVTHKYQQAQIKRQESIDLYTQAQQILESELGLDTLHFDKPVGYTALFSELELSRRFDSEHYYPAFDNLKDQLPKHVQLVPLGSVLTCCQRGKQPIYSASGLPVLNSKHILENKITLEGNRHAKPTSVTGLQIQYGDVLINGTGRGTIGRTAPYLVSEHQAIPDNHVTILRSSTLDPAYLSFYLNSLAGKLQVEKYQRGSSGQLELYPFDIRKFQVWEAPQPIQQEIRRLYDQATESARQSKQLLDQAKSRVEQIIEEAVKL